MGTKTVDETGAPTRADEDTADTAATEGAVGTEGAGETAHAAQDGERTPRAGEADVAATAADGTEEAAKGAPGVGQGAGAVVSAALGIVSLTGGWIGTVASARQSLIGQLETSSSSDIATMIEKGYGNAWHATALWGGLFAVAALIVGVVVLARPAFGAPGRPQAPWIKSVAWAGVALGVVGLLLAVLKYTDVLLGLPSTS